MNPTIGRIVHYRLSESDATAINKRRNDFKAFSRNHAQPVEAGEVGATGHVGHVGNEARAGDVFPAAVVRTFGGTAANLQVLLDGTDTYWATSRAEGTADGTWAWPERVA